MIESGLDNILPRFINESKLPPYFHECKLIDESISTVESRIYGYLCILIEVAIFPTALKGIKIIIEDTLVLETRCDDKFSRTVNVPPLITNPDRCKISGEICRFRKTQWNSDCTREIDETAFLANLDHCKPFRKI